MIKGLAPRALFQANSGFKRIDQHFCEASPRINVTPLGLDWTTAGTLELDLSSLFNPIPPTLSFILLSFQLQPQSSGVALTVNGINVHACDDAAGINIYESAIGNITEQVAIVAGTQLGTITPIIKFPVHGLPNAVKIYRNVIIVGGGGLIPQIRLIGYWD